MWVRIFNQVVWLSKANISFYDAIRTYYVSFSILYLFNRFAIAVVFDTVIAAKIWLDFFSYIDFQSQYVQCTIHDIQKLISAALWNSGLFVPFLLTFDISSEIIIDKTMS